MLTSELIEHIASGVLKDRANYIEGTTEGELWSDATLLVYLNQAQDLFARRSYCLLDNTTVDVTQIALADATQTYNLHKSILKVFSARISDTPARLRQKSFLHLTSEQVEQTISVGRPTVWWTDTTTKTISVAPIPTPTEAGLKLYLQVARLPITKLVLNATSAPEIPEQYHLDLCDYVVHRCLMHQETDSEAQNDSVRFLRSFEAAAREARREVQRLIEPPSSIEFTEPR